MKPEQVKNYLGKKVIVKGIPSAEGVVYLLTAYILKYNPKSPKPDKLFRQAEVTEINGSGSVSIVPLEGVEGYEDEKGVFSDGEKPVHNPAE